MVPVLFLLAFAAAPQSVPTNINSWVPARWNSHDLKSLDLVQKTPVNCLLLEERDWDPAFIEEADRRGIATLGVIHPDEGNTWVPLTVRSL